MRAVVVAVLGGLLTLAGIALLVLPGPGFVLVAAGLAVLATQFQWARRPLEYAKGKAQQGIEEVARSPWRTALAVAAALVLVALGVVALAGVDLPFVNALSAVFLVLSGLFLVGTVVYARRQEHSGGRRPHGSTPEPGAGTTGAGTTGAGTTGAGTTGAGTVGGGAHASGQGRAGS